MAEEQWEDDIMIDYTQPPMDTSSVRMSLIKLYFHVHLRYIVKINARYGSTTNTVLFTYSLSKDMLRAAARDVV